MPLTVTTIEFEGTEGEKGSPLKMCEHWAAHWMIRFESRSVCVLIANCRYCNHGFKSNGRNRGNLKWRKASLFSHAAKLFADWS